MHRRTKLSSNRRGAVLALVAVSLTVLLGFAGLAVDGARYYLAKAQAKRLADAAVLASVRELRGGGTPANAVSSGQAIRANNTVLGQVVPTSSLLILPCKWISGTDIVNPGACAEPRPAMDVASAVEAIVRYDMPTSLARIFRPTLRVEESSVAMVGSLQSSECLRPWAVPYTMVLTAAGRVHSWNVNDPNDFQPIFDDKLTETEIAGLKASPTITIGSAIGISSGGYGYIQVSDVNGATGVVGSIIGCNGYKNQVGDFRNAESGWMSTAINALETLCQSNNLTSPPNNPQFKACTSQPIIEVPFVSGLVPLSGPLPAGVPESARGKYHLKYIGAMQVTHARIRSSDPKIFDLMGRLKVISPPHGGKVSDEVGPVQTSTLAK